MKTRLILILSFLTLFYNSYSLLTLENNFNLTLNPSSGEDRGISILVENDSYLILAEKNDGNTESVLIVKILPNKTKVWEYEKVIGGPRKIKWFYDPYYLMKDKEGNYFWCGETYQHGWEGGFYLEKFSSEGKKLCSYQWDSTYSAADELVFLLEDKNKIFAVGRRHSKNGLIYVFDKNCNLIERLEREIGCGYNEGIFSLIKVNESFFIFPQLCYENNYYTIRVYALDYNSKKYFLLNRFKNLTVKNLYGKEYHFLNSSNIFIAGGVHYPSYNISLFGFYQNLSLAYLHTYPFKGTLHHGDLGWRKGTVIYAGDNGFTAYLFNATTGELIARYNSSLPTKAYALDVKRDSIPGCYMLIGSEQVSNGDWQIRMERICEADFSELKANFSFITKGLNVSFIPSVNGCDNTCSYFWDFGDGSYSFEKQPSHLYPASGNYTVTLIVKKDKKTSIAGKNVEIRSIFKAILVKKAVLQNSEFQVKILLREDSPLTVKFRDVVKTFEGKSAEFTFSTNLPRGIYLLEISVKNETIFIPIRIMNQSEYEAYLSLASVKYDMERKLFEISQKLTNLTFEVGKYYFGEYATGKITFLKEKMNNILESKVKIFAEILSKYSKSLSKVLEERAPKVSESTVNWIFEQASELGKRIGNRGLTQVIYKYYLLPGISKYSIDEEKIIYANETQMRKIAESSKKIVLNIENLPVYNLSFQFFEIAPSFSYFQEKTTFSTQVPEIMSPVDLLELIKADVNTLLLVPLILGYVNHTKIKISALPAIPAIITAVKVYIGVSKTVSKISPGLLLFGSYISSNVISEKIMPDILEQSYFRAKSLNGCKLNLAGIYQKGNISVNVFSNCQDSNLYVTISKNGVLKDYWIVYIEKNYENNFSYTPELEGSYLVKSCVFQGNKNLICKAISVDVNYSSPVLSLLNDVSGIRVFNPTNFSIQAKIICENKTLSFLHEPKEERKIECQGNILVYANGTFSDKEILFKPKKISYCYPSKIFVRSGEKIKINCIGYEKTKIISPSGKIYEIKANESFLPLENGTWEIYGLNSQAFFVVEKKSRLRALNSEEKLIVVNEFGRRINNVKIVYDGFIIFTDENGEAKIKNSSFIYVYKPGYEESYGYELEKDISVEAFCKEPFVEVVIKSTNIFNKSVNLCVNKVCKKLFLFEKTIKLKFIAQQLNEISIDTENVIEEVNESNNFILLKCSAKTERKIENTRITEKYIYPNLIIFKEFGQDYLKIKILKPEAICEFSVNPFMIKKLFISPSCEYLRIYGSYSKKSIKGVCYKKEIEECEEIFKYLS